jgi:hypothetical protein
MEIALIVALVVAFVITFVSLVYAAMANERAIHSLEVADRRWQSIEGYQRDYHNVSKELARWQKRHRKIVKQLGYDPDAMNLSE